MQSVGIATSRHKTPGKRVDNDNTVFVDHIINVAVHDTVCANCLIDMVGQRCVFGISVVFNTEIFLSTLGTARCENGIVGFFVYNVVGIDIVLRLLFIQLLDNKLFERAHKSIGLVVHICRLLAGARNDQRRARLIDKD